MLGKPQKYTSKLKFRTQGGKLPLEEHVNHLRLGISSEDTHKAAKDRSIEGWVRSP